MAVHDFQVRRGLAVLLALAVLVIGVVIGSLATAKAVSGRAVPIIVSSGGAGPAAGQVSFQTGFAPVVREVANAVVNISSTKVVKNNLGPLAPFLNDPALRQFFGGQMPDIPQRQRETSLGSGVIVNGDGYVLTNNHVVEGSSDVRVFLADKREFRAKIVGTDPRTDIAVVKIDATGLPAMRLGDSSRIQVGEFCVAIGNPFGLRQTVTSGIVSAKSRTGLGIEGPGAYEDFIQTDAPINPGNSGGALVNVRGELIGINTAILSGGSAEGQGGSIGIGFAVPINLARAVMDQIIKTGKVTRAYMGIVPQDVTAPIARAFALPGQPRGIIVGSVEPNGPAARAGIKQGDILLEMNGRPLPDVGEFRIQIGLMAPGSDVTFRVFRNGAEQNITVKLGAMPANEGQPQRRRPADGGTAPGSALQGLSVDTLTPDIARQIGVPANTRGVVITDVEEGSPAADTGLQRGDVIMEVNRKPVGNVEEFAAAVRAAGKQTLLLLVNQRGAAGYITVEPQ